jgi:hypothetical protein
MKASKIISEIEEIVESQTGGVYSKWRIGTANDADDSENEHGNPDSWRDWDTDTPEDAEKVESYFVDKGMRSEGPGFGDPDFVYIFYSGSPQETF